MGRPPVIGGPLKSLMPPLSPPKSPSSPEPSWARYLKVQPRRLDADEQVGLAGGNAEFLLGL